jgi:predicted nucleotidyltransferase component of viral defense system
MIPQQNLSLVSNRLQKQYGGRRIPEAVIERDYCLAWLLNGIAESRLRSVLAFKGGTALKRCYFVGYRFSEDLDFTLTEAVPLQQILGEFEQVYRWVVDACGTAFRFDREDRQSHINSHTFYLGYQGPLPTANDLKVRHHDSRNDHAVDPRPAHSP